MGKFARIFNNHRESGPRFNVSSEGSTSVDTNVVIVIILGLNGPL